VAYAVDAAEHHGLQWEEPGVDGGPFAAIAGTKVRDALEGATESTIEVVADMQEGMGSFSSRVLVIGQGAADARLGLFVSRDPQRPYFRWRGSTDAAIWDIDFPTVGRAVFHVVLETTAEPDDRLRLYVNGIRAPVADDENWPEHGEAIDFTDDSVLVLGNRAPGFGERSFKGILYYGALYSVAFDERRIQTHVEVLLGSDDTPDEG
jgi:hypothetical protein